MLSVGGMKVKTVGYYKTRKEAIVAYYNAYITQFKNEPFDLRDYVKEV